MSDNMLWQSNNNADATVVRGDAGGFGGSTTSSPMDAGAPIWLEGMSVDANATNSMGAVGGTQSDPMFDKFKHEATGNEDQNQQTGSNSPEGVAGSSIPSGSDPMFDEVPHDNSVNNV